MSPKLYHEIAEAIAKIAQHHNLVPNAVQAILWHQWRKMHSVMRSAQGTFFPDDLFVVKGLLEVEINGASL